ncbi:hypothetical protein [Thiococcus pfennigii]|uniref:hypothetical protein n=1 Tax=Thiococcus pfennigii TaxID=1057 RepID=UPI001902EDDF|nr:hypothetical protein [Thiococcus pfennigii]MBK1699375.1 hypothetical protein [Thiococcus pfennigii]
MIERVIVPSDPTERKARLGVRYYPRQLMTADDMSQEQHYWREKLRRHNRLMHGWGVMCGLDVEQPVHGYSRIPWTITISAGHALSPSGDEVAVDKPLEVDLRGLWTEQGFPEEVCSGSTHTAFAGEQTLPVDTPLFLAIRPCEHLESPIQISPLSCGCVETQCEYSRILDGTRIAILTELPELYENEATGTDCAPSCPTAPQESWIVLADIEADGDGDLTIKYTNRFVLSVDRGKRCTSKRSPWDSMTNMPEIDIPGSMPAEEHIEMPTAAGFSALVPIRFTVNPEDADAGETLESLADREKNRRFFDPLTGHLVSLGELFDRSGVDKQTLVKSVADINAVLRDKVLG